MIDVCTLGTGGAIPLPQRALSSLYVRVNGRGLLIDCGEGTQTQIRRLGWGFRNIDDIFITHYHCDHCGGLPGFFLSMAKTGRTEPLRIWGPIGLCKLLESIRIFCPQLPYNIEPHELSATAESHFSLIDMKATSIPLHHGMPCLGVHLFQERTSPFMPNLAQSLNVPVSMWKRLKSGECVTLQDGTIISADQVTGPKRPGISLLYATDTRPLDIIAHYGQGTQLMVLQGMYGDDAKKDQALRNKHMLFREAAQLAVRAGTNQLLLTHFSNSIDIPDDYLPQAQSLFPQTQTAYDLMTVKLDYPNETI